eukprot:jgi/Tetstr1/431273/TSEL_020969.t1
MLLGGSDSTGGSKATKVPPVNEPRPHLHPGVEADGGLAIQRAEEGRRVHPGSGWGVRSPLTPQHMSGFKARRPPPRVHVRAPAEVEDNLKWKMPSTNTGTPETATPRHDLSGFEERYAVVEERRKRRRAQSQSAPWDGLAARLRDPAGSRPPPWVRVTAPGTKRAIAEHFGVSGAYARGTIIVATQRDKGCFPGSMALPARLMRAALEAGYWTRVAASERRCLVVQEEACHMSLWRPVAGSAAAPALPPSPLFSPKAHVALIVEFSHNAGARHRVGVPLQRLAEATAHTVRSSHRGPIQRAFKTHAGWGHIAMSGMTFRPGNGQPGASPGPWLYDSWANPPPTQAEKAQLRQGIVEGIDMDWRWLASNFPGKHACRHGTRRLRSTWCFRP